MAAPSKAPTFQTRLLLDLAKSMGVSKYQLAHMLDVPHLHHFYRWFSAKDPVAPGGLFMARAMMLQKVYEGMKADGTEKRLLEQKDWGKFWEYMERNA